MIFLIYGILKKQAENQAHIHREQIGGCKRLGGGSDGEMGKQLFFSV